MASFPEWIEPMAATLTYERFEGPEWIFERKLDGIRLLALDGGRPALLAQPIAAEPTRHGPGDRRLPVADVILDGELLWQGTPTTSSMSCGSRDET